MEAKLKFCDYINNINFMRIEDKGNHFEVRMKSVVKSKDFHTSAFYNINGLETPKYFYLLEFSKAIL